MLSRAPRLESVESTRRPHHRQDVRIILLRASRARDCEGFVNTWWLIMVVLIILDRPHSERVGPWIGYVFAILVIAALGVLDALKVIP